MKIDYQKLVTTLKRKDPGMPCVEVMQQSTPAIPPYAGEEKKARQTNIAELAKLIDEQRVVPGNIQPGHVNQPQQKLLELVPTERQIAEQKAILESLQLGRQKI